MIKVKKVMTNKQRRAFVNFPLKLYKNCSHYAPLFYSDEKKLLCEDTNIYSDYSDSAFFLAYNEKGKVVGRIGAIINYAHINKVGQKNVRFTRLDAIDDRQVFAALFEAVEDFAKSNDIYRVHGPLGYNDLDKEGLLIEGFDWDQTYGGVYNYDYYQGHVEALGYGKEFDWIERRVKVPDEVNPKLMHVAQKVQNVYGFREVLTDDMSTKELLDKYSEKFFGLVDECYEKLHGTVPLTAKAKESLVSGLKIIVNTKYVSVIVDKDDNAVGVGLILPAIWHALHKSKGKLFPFGFFHFLPLLVKEPKEFEMALIGVKPEYQNKGVSAMIVARIWSNLLKTEVRTLESNANLEDNYEINNFMKKYEEVQHKRRRCFYKELQEIGNKGNEAESTTEPKEDAVKNEEPQTVEVKSDINAEDIAKSNAEVNAEA